MTDGRKSGRRPPTRPRLRFTRCSFIGADLRHATLDGCSFKFCDFSGADARGASLREVGLSASP
ncbi:MULTISPECIES: pentapeptide repeat-containing protein [unclassified Streptomyces]|uniref:pentapeptide repeat-containing protein n=1 Tax=unclassified Streptomyces TaxID=2593676 RepID=UPI0030913611|nr:pentapeptide repeat-containing protein [Streptomyces sp. NBC_01237]